MIAVALPDVADDFDVSTGRAAVLVTVYLVAMLVGQPFAGRLCDVIGARRLATIATTGFGLLSLAAMAAGSFAVLVGLRGAQAVFASALVPSVQTMLRQLVPEHQRGRAFGILGSIIGAGAGLGPVVGGLATAAFGWRAIFGVNIPVVVASAYALRRRVPGPVHSPDPPAGHTIEGSARVLNPVFAAAFSTQALSTLAQYGLLLAVPIVLDARGWGAASIGVALSALTVGLVITGPPGGRLGDARGRRWPVVLGMSVTVVAVGASAIRGDDVPSSLLVGTLVLFGLGLGIATPSVMTAGLEAAPPAKVGAAAGLLSSSRYVGSIASTVVLAGVMHDDGSGLGALLVVCAASLVACVAIARQLPGRPPGRELAEDGMPAVP
jgi:MFS family permease